MQRGRLDSLPRTEANPDITRTMIATVTELRASRGGHAKRLSSIKVGLPLSEKPFQIKGPVTVLISGNPIDSILESLSRRERQGFQPLSTVRRSPVQNGSNIGPLISYDSLHPDGRA